MRHTILTFLVLVVALSATAQCTPDSTAPCGQFELSDSLPCLVFGEPVSFTVQFNVPVTATIGMNSVLVQWMVVDSVLGLPNGLVAIPDDTFYTAGEYGCLTITGIPVAPSGSYQAALGIDASLGGILMTPIIVLDFSSSLLGLDFILRVVDSAGAPCPVIGDTIQGQCECLSPSELEGSLTFPDSVLLTWEYTPAAVFEVRGGVLGSDTSTWVNFNTSGTAIPVFGLPILTEFVWQVRASCINGVVSAWSELDTFGTICPIPELLDPWIISGACDVKLRWAVAREPDGVAIRGRLLGSSTYTASLVIPKGSPAAISRSLDVIGLTTLANQYEWQMRSFCKTPAGSFFKTVWATDTFNIDTCVQPVQKADILDPGPDLLQVFPNPAYTTVTIELPEEEAQWTVELLGLDGKLITSSQSFGKASKLDLSGMPQGLYLIRVITRHHTYIRRMVVNHQK